MRQEPKNESAVFSRARRGSLLFVAASIMPNRFTGGQVRYFRKLRANSVAAAARKQEQRAAAHPRPRPKSLEHIEDILFKNGLRFVRPGDQRILGVTMEGIAIDQTAASKQ